MVRNRESHSLFRTVGFFDYTVIICELFRGTPASEFAQGYSRFQPADEIDDEEIHPRRDSAIASWCFKDASKPGLRSGRGSL
jgi:hypothetical protein